MASLKNILSQFPKASTAWTAWKCSKYHINSGLLSSGLRCTGREYVTDAAKINKQRRIELAAAYRAMEKCDMHEGVDTHITLMSPAADNSGREVMLLVPEGLYWSEVTPSCLMGLDAGDEIIEGSGSPMVTALCIHKGVRSRYKHTAVAHLHSPYTTALGCLKDPTVRTMHQTMLIYHDRIAYDLGFNGYGIKDEGDRLCRELGEKIIMMMGNHGFLTVGDTMALAMNRAYYMERVCMVQLLAMSSGKPIRDISDDVIKNSMEYARDSEPFYADKLLQAYIKLFTKDCHEFKEYEFPQHEHCPLSSV